MPEHRFGGQWTEDKLVRLQKYLHAYMMILSKNPRGAPTAVKIASNILRE